MLDTPISALNITQKQGFAWLARNRFGGDCNDNSQEISLRVLSSYRPSHIIFCAIFSGYLTSLAARSLNARLCRPESNHAIRNLGGIILHDGLALTGRQLVEQIAETGVETRQHTSVNFR